MEEADLLYSAHASMGHGQVIGAIQISVHWIWQCSLLIHLYMQHGDIESATGKHHGTAPHHERGASALCMSLPEEAQSLKASSAVTQVQVALRTYVPICMSTISTHASKAFLHLDVIVLLCQVDR